MNKKTLLKVVLALVLATSAYFAYRTFYQPNTQDGVKELQLIIEVQEEDGSMKTIFDQRVETETEILADFLLEMDKGDELQIGLTGNVSDPYGRSLTSINGYEITDWASGPWWLYDSENNIECKEAEFCPGIDSCPIYDEDIFVFSYTSTIE